MGQIPTNVSDSVRKRNPHLYGGPTPSLQTSYAVASAAKRLRQATKPKLNKLETKFLNWMRTRKVTGTIRIQALRFELCNGVTYTPDLTVGTKEAYEIKGPKAWDDAIVKLKMAARVWPEVHWFIVWEVDNIWKQQMILA